MLDTSHSSRETERRLTERLPIEIKFKYRLLNTSKDAYGIQSEGVTKNISTSGLLFESKEQINLDTKLKILLNLPGIPEKLLEVESSVIRIEKLFSSAGFNIGVNFTDISEDVKEEIKCRIERLNIITLLGKVNKEEFSDLHLTVNSPPMVRRYGKIIPLDDKPLADEEIKQMIYSILSDEQKKHFELYKDLDFAFSPDVNSRYRVSIYQQRGKAEIVFRNIMPNLKSRQELGLDEVVDEFCQLKDGILIIGGTTGSGKTTSIATIIDIINRERGGVVLSLEKPIEYLHQNIKAIIKQREVGVDVSSFAVGLKSALRQDPDVIVVGEMVDPDSVETALEAAETGHLVITSLHVTDTVQVFDRLVTFFPLEQRSFIYGRLAHSLKAIIIQGLLPRSSGSGRILATEVCIVNNAVRRIIHSGDFTQLPSVIQTGAQYKMHLMQNSIDKLFEQGLIDGETYEAYSKK